MSNSLNPGPCWAEIHAHPDFAILEKKRREVVVRLLLVTFVTFFSIPFISSLFPDVFRMKVYGAINLGLGYMVAQYFIGGAIAWRYAKNLATIDTLLKSLLLAVSPSLNKDGR